MAKKDKPGIFVVDDAPIISSAGFRSNRGAQCQVSVLRNRRINLIGPCENSAAHVGDLRIP